MDTRMVQEQRLSRKMNQSLLQSLHILQFSSLELLAYIEQITKENPLIEEIDYDPYITDYKVNTEDVPSVGERNSKEETMYDKLKNQLYTLRLDSTLKRAVLFGIDSLNEDGYIEIDLDEWAERCGLPMPQIDAALKAIQSLEPAGVGARDLSECILLQLDLEQEKQTLATNLIHHHLDWIAEEAVEAIVSYYGVGRSEVMAILTAIKSCHPKPGRLLANPTADYIIPEANIIEERGDWKIVFYKWNHPIIQVRKAYQDFQATDPEAMAYIKEKRQQLDWLSKSISQRASTLERILKEIVRLQHSFFEHGHFMLQPMKMQDIAQILDMHVSTISRAIRGKHVQTPYGVLPIKFFFQSGINNQAGKQTAAFTVKQLIAELIQYEDKQQPLSDESIKNKLGSEFGIILARRTVMKYRKQLNIPSSTKRKR